MVDHAAGTTPPNLDTVEGSNEEMILSPAYEVLKLPELGPDAMEFEREVHAQQLGRILDRIKQKYEDGVSAMEENRRLHSEDLNFVYNSETSGQWDPQVLQARQGKPCYTFNRVIGPVNLVVADMRQTRPSINVRPRTDGSTQAVADALGGLWRSMEQASRATVTYNNQYKFAVAGGYGAWRLTPVYAGDDTFDQTIRLMDIPNPQTVVWDAESTDPCCADANYCLVGSDMSRDKFNAEYPGVSDTSISISRDSAGWFSDKNVRVAEYYERVPFEKEIALLSDGTVVDYDSVQKAVTAHMKESKITGGATVVRTRKVLKYRVMWCKVNGAAVIEGPIFYNWQRIPVIRVPGRYINIEGKKKLQSLIRHSKDAQRSYNSRNSDMIERSALMPKAPYLVTETMIKGYEAEWQQANTASRPFLPYNIDPKAVEAGGMPQRTPPIDVPQAALAMIQQNISDIQATTGFFDPAMGNADDMNRVSGKALVQHTRRSDLSSYEFIDGFGCALQLTAEIFIDMVPSIYDAERVERIIGVDGTDKLVTLNGDPDDSNLVLDLKSGAYDCTVTIGPSYQTARQETLDTLINAAKTIPAIANMAPDLIAKNLDSPDAAEMTRRLRIPLIHQGFVNPTPEEQQNNPPPPPPDPLKQAELQSAQSNAVIKQSQATIAQSKAAVSDLNVHDLIYKTAGQHLKNLLDAQKFFDGKAQQEAMRLEQEEETAASTPTPVNNDPNPK